MADYKSTLNLPKTSFSMKANLAQKEPMRLNAWTKKKLYQRIRAHNEGQEKFILHDGPPYANGDIHVGHAVNKILKDIVVRSKTFSGYNAPYVPGWDCHGLPIELKVEKEIGKPGVDVDANVFRKACRKYALKQVKRQRKDFERLGILGQWDEPYLTMNFAYEANMVRTLAKIIENGHLAKGFKPVHWCCDCGSALAEAEVEYKNKISPAIDVKFALENISAWQKAFSVHKLEKPASIVIWTTTPWTLPANQAIAISNDVGYSLVDIGDEYLILASNLIEVILKRAGVHTYIVIDEIKGEKLTGLKAHHPFYDRIVPIVHGDHVTTDSGTGAVHTAPAHGVEDFTLSKAHNLPIDNPVDNHGHYLESTPLFAGEFVFDANEHVIEVLKENNKLLAIHKLDHSYPHCWRHKTPLIFRATPQWFISMEKKGLRNQAMSAIDTTEWIPSWGKNRIDAMISDRPDWCISRQRTWGVPIPLFTDKNTGALHPDTLEIMGKVAALIEKGGVEAWFNADSSEFIEDIDNYERVTDTLDVWFDSGSTNACVLEHFKDLSFPADLYLEGSDQHRGWFQTSLLIALARRNEAPFKQVLTHGFTVDAEGKKMSKSLGNVVSPQEVVDTLGADILRLWVASTDYRSEMTVSDEILKRTADTYRRLRNTARFLLSNLQGFNPETDLVPFDQLIALDKWAVAKAHNVQNSIIKAYDEYQFHIVTQNIHHFCSIEMGSFYLDIIKDRQYTASTNGHPRKSAQSAMYHIVQALVRWMSPILCFSADEIYDAIPGENEELLLEKWYDQLEDINASDGFDMAYWEQIQQVRSECNKLLESKRAEGEIGASLEAEITLYVKDELYHALDKLKDELRFALIVSNATIKPYLEAPESAIQTAIDTLKVDISKAQGKKCERCWHRQESVGAYEEHPDICSRCIENITTEKGERREFA